MLKITYYMKVPCFSGFLANLNLKKTNGKTIKIYLKMDQNTMIAFNGTTGAPGFTFIIHYFNMWRELPIPYGLSVAGL